jgi:hypothetical protein
MCAPAGLGLIRLDHFRCFRVRSTNLGYASMRAPMQVKKFDIAALITD